MRFQDAVRAAQAARKTSVVLYDPNGIDDLVVVIDQPMTLSPVEFVCPDWQVFYWPYSADPGTPSNDRGIEVDLAAAELIAEIVEQRRIDPEFTVDILWWKDILPELPAPTIDQARPYDSFSAFKRGYTGDKNAWIYQTQTLMESFWLAVGWLVADCIGVCAPAVAPGAPLTDLVSYCNDSNWLA